MKRQKGMSLVEVLVSLVLLSIIAVPFLSLFIHSTEKRLTAQKMVYANYAAANQMEKLAAMGCYEVCSSNGELVEGNMLIKRMSIPWVAQQQPCFYFIFQNGGQSGYQCMIIPPDGGKGIFKNDMDQSVHVQLIIDGDEYRISVNDSTISGKIEGAEKPLILVNAANKPEDMLVNLEILGSADAVVYSSQDGIEVQLDGNLTVNPNVYYRDYTLFRSVVEVYDIEDAGKLLARVEGILRIPN